MTDPAAFLSAQARPSASIAVVPFAAAGPYASYPLLRAYIDETGDRGVLKGNASPIFGMAAVLVDDAGEKEARRVLHQLRADVHTPSSRPLSWKADLKNHERRKRAASLFAAIGQGIQVVYVMADKATLAPGTYRDDRTLFYNVIAYATLERILWASARWPSGPTQVQVRFGHVKDHDHTDTHRYFQIKQSQVSNVRFGHIAELSWVNARQYEMSQVADVYAGFLKAAFWPDDFGAVEGAYLCSVWDQIRQVNGCPISLGLQTKPVDSLARSAPWWPCRCSRCVTP